MSLSVTLCSEADIPEGTGLHFRVGHREVAVFRREGRFFAIEGICPHEGAPLGHGDLEGGCVVCPRHGWTYDLETGFCEQDPEHPIARFPARVEAGMVVIELP
jgi:nitrite reductase/ring-hydroxylating ferredoxin subunit